MYKALTFINDLKINLANMFINKKNVSLIKFCGLYIISANMPVLKRRTIE